VSGWHLKKQVFWMISNLIGFADIGMLKQYLAFWNVRESQFSLADIIFNLGVWSIAGCWPTLQQHTL
jgi:hypothetical protein